MYAYGGLWGELLARQEAQQHGQELTPECTTWWECLVGFTAESLTSYWGILVVPGYVLAVIGLLLLFVFIMEYVIPEFILAPLIWVLRILPRWAKALNLLLIVVAFHFNLLAS
jgi:hypothetical protein